MKKFESINHDLRRKHDGELTDARRKFEDELNEYRKKMEQELMRINKAKDEEERQLQLQRVQDAQTTAANHEAEMSALRSQWEVQMQELRKQHEDHVKIAIAKDLIVDELERVRNALSRRDEDVMQLQSRYDEERSILFEERLKKEEELSQARTEARDRDWNQAKQQEELVILRGTARRWEEEDQRHKEEIQQMRNTIAGKDRDCQSLLEQNIALAQESRTKDDKITQLHSNANQHKDVRTLLQEHDSIVEKFRAEVVALQTENSRLKFSSDEMKREVDRLRDELRTKALDLNQMTAKFEMDVNLFENALVEQQAQFENLDARFLDYQRQAEQERGTQVTQSEEYKIAMERQREETEQIRNELTQIEELCKVQTAQLEEARAAAFSAESSEWDRAKQQEELVVLRGITRRKDEEKLRLELGASLCVCGEGCLCA